MRRRACRPPPLRDALPPAPPPGPAPAPAPGHGAAGARRIAALHLPLLAVERLRLPGPLALWSTEGSRRLVTAACPLALAAGLHPGQALADAQAILPEVALHPAAPAADAAWLRRLALWAHCITPLPALDPPDGLLLDLTGLAHLQGGEAALAEAILARFARAGVTARLAIAGHADTAAALARAGTAAALARAGTAAAAAPLLVPEGGERAAIAPLPLAALRLPAATIAALHRLGLRRIGEVLDQPRAPLARRFGAALVEALDAATGARPRPIRPVRPVAAFLAARDFLEPIVTREAIDATLALLLPELCRQLAEAGQGARRLVLRAFRVDGGVQALAIGTGLPARDPRHFARLLRDPLGRLEPGFGFERLALEARATAPLAAAQSSLPGEGRAAGEARRQALAELLDRLSQRLPVWRPGPRASHWPERAVQRLSPFATAEAPPGWPGPAPRPLRLLRRPVALQAMALLPDAPPSLLRCGRAAWRVARAEGPERIEPEWWRDRPDRLFRDYYRVELASGARLWVCRSGPGANWWLHGRFE